jgi:hypothetical protein
MENSSDSNSDERNYIMLISGYRKFENYDVFKSALDGVIVELGLPKLLLQGECKTGADQLAKRWCIENDVACEGFPANWELGKRAGPERNTIMLNKADVVCAFIHKESKGTKDVVKKAREKEKILYEFDITKLM